MNILETERLRLRPFKPDEWTALARFYADDTVMRHMLPGRGLKRAEAEARAKSNIHNFNDHWARMGFGIWAIEDRAQTRLIGQCGLRYVPEAEAVELLYLLNKTHWGRGLATEAAHAAVEYAFGPAKLEKLVAFTDPQNAASRNVLGKLGFSDQGEREIWQHKVRWFEQARMEQDETGLRLPA